MSVSEVSAVPPVRTATVPPVPAVQPVEPPQPAARPLEPAVRIDIRSGERPAAAADAPRPADAPPVEQTERRVTVDTETRSLVYQVVDAASGDIVVQLPDPVVLKARAYAEAAAAKVQAAARPLDRTA